jgi:hypothetical protein
MPFFDAMTITEFCDKYRIDERGKNDLILTVASLQAVGMLIGFGACAAIMVILVLIGRIKV